MNLIHISFLSTVFLATALTCNAQQDTIVNGQHYNHISYYQNGRIHELGNLTSKRSKSVRDGDWIFFEEDGTIAGRGAFSKGKKEGTWWYGKNCFTVYKKDKKVKSRCIHWI